MSEVTSVRLQDSSLTDADGVLRPLVSDLLEIAGQAFVLDRCTPRGASPDDPRWSRTLHLRAEVQLPEIWSDPAVAGHLVALLAWLTDDVWDVRFSSCRRRDTARQIPLSVDTHPRHVMLFSGGLDAVAGSALLAEESHLEAVAVVTNPAMRGYQRRAFGHLSKQLGSHLAFSPVDFSVVNSGSSDNEPTRRTRGLVFLAIGAAAALQRGTSEVLIAENGVGALNLPFTAAQTGAMTSRAVHPRTLRLASDWLSAALQEPFRIRNPFITWTKGQMVQALPASMREACAMSQSCDNAAAGRGHLERRCGHCTSCLLRRLSFAAARRSSWDSEPYLSDTEIRPDRWRLPEMLWQAARLDRALSSEEPADLLVEFPSLSDLDGTDISIADLRPALAIYVDEWRRFRHPDVRRYLSSRVARTA